MSITVLQSYKAIAPGRTTSFRGTNGVPPYVYTVIPGGAGGTIDASTGVYTAPVTIGYDAKHTIDKIEVTDSLLDTGTATVSVGDALVLFCDILRTELGLAPDRVYLYNQKIEQPKDFGMYVVVSILHEKPFGNVLKQAIGGAEAEAYVSVISTIGVDIISRGPEARDRRFEVLIALASVYSQQQQEANGFSVGRVPLNFVNLSLLDGAAIPYRFHMDITITHSYAKRKAVPYFDAPDLPNPIVNS